MSYDGFSGRIFVVGSSGYIGSRLSLAGDKYSTVFGTSSKGGGGLLALDLDRPVDFDYGLICPGDLVYLTAAISSPDMCAGDTERVWGVNVSGTSIFIERAIDLGARVVFFSSDAVYGEREEPFDERAFPRPVGEYAVMKHEVERRFLSNPSFKSIRLSYVFSRFDKFTNLLLERYLDGVEVDLFHPFYRSIVYCNDVVEGALALGFRWDAFPEPVINFGGPKVLSRVMIADCLRETCLPGLRYKIVEPLPAFFDNRPRVIAMESPVFQRLLGRQQTPLHVAACSEF